jgi:sulfur-carrier protein
MAIVTLRYWAAAKEATGVAEEKAEAATLAEALDLAASQSDGLRRILPRCSFLISGDPVGTRPHEAIVLAQDAVIEVLPPFAGG